MTAEKTAEQQFNSIVRNLFKKVPQVVVQTRASNPATQSLGIQKEKNTWFQLFTYDYNIVIENTKLWKTTAMYKHPLHIEVLLHLPSMKDNESFVAKSGGDKLLISGDYFQTRRTIVLEEWKLSLNPHASTRDDYKGAYLRSSIFIRALEAYCHLLPAYSLLKRIRLAAQNPQSHLHKFVVGFRVSKDLTLQPTECGLDSPLNGWENDTVATVQFPGTLETMLGTFHLQVRYRENCNYDIIQHGLSTSESYLASSNSNSSEPAMWTSDERQLKSPDPNFDEFAEAQAQVVPDRFQSPSPSPPRSTTKSPSSIQSNEDNEWNDLGSRSRSSSLTQRTAQLEQSRRERMAKLKSNPGSATMLEPGTPTVDQTTGRKTPVREIATTATTTTTVAASPPTPGSVAIAIGSTPAEPVSFNRRPSVVLAMQAASLPVDMDSPQQDHRQLQLTRVRPFKGTPSNEDLGPSLLSTKEEFPLVSPTSSDHPFGTSASRPIPVMTTRSRASSFKNSVPGSVPAGSFTGRAPSISPPTFMQQPMGTPHSLNRDRLLERSDIENYLAILRSSIDVDQSMPPSLQGVGGTATQGAWDEEDELDKFRKQSEDILALSQALLSQEAAGPAEVTPTKAKDLIPLKRDVGFTVTSAAGDGSSSGSGSGSGSSNGYKRDVGFSIDLPLNDSLLMNVMDDMPASAIESASSTARTTPSGLALLLSRPSSGGAPTQQQQRPFDDLSTPHFRSVARTSTSDDGRFHDAANDLMNSSMFIRSVTPSPPSSP